MTEADGTDARVVRVDTPAGVPSYDVVVDAGGRAVEAARAWAAAREEVPAVVADARVVALHGPLLDGAPTLTLEGGEHIKDLAHLGRVLDFCAEAGLSRRGALVSYGGGTVGDLTGLAASLFKRGVAVAHVPTTLLAQADSSVGGKTAINLTGGKNLAGTFHHPAAVFCDAGLLATVDDAEIASGLGEVLKTALIGGEEHVARLEAAAAAALARDGEALRALVRDCVEVKARVVGADPEERGLRRVLNLGHTFGHAIEHAAGYGAVPHGVAVAVGLGLATDASVRALGADAGLPARVRRLLERLGLPPTLAALRRTSGAGDRLGPEALAEGLRHDKKAAVGAPEFVLLRAPGDVVPGVPLDPEALTELLSRP